jgi:hypothetical protein
MSKEVGFQPGCAGGWRNGTNVAKRIGRPAIFLPQESPL